MPPSPSAAGDERWLGVLVALVLTVLSTGVVSSTLLPEAVASSAGLANGPDAQPGPDVVPAVIVLPELVPAPAAAPSPPAEAAVDPLCGGEGWERRRGQAALASLRRPADAAPFRISYEPGRSGVVGEARLHERRLRVFVRGCDELSPSLLAHVVAHELGHLVDVTRMNGDLRTQWLAARGIPAGTPWYGCSSCTDFATPAGDFAEVYAQWQIGGTGNRSRLAPAPSPGELEELAARFF